MAIPDYQTIMLPLLRSIGDGREYSIKDITENLARLFSLTDDEVETRFTNSGMKVFYIRVSWARTYLKKAGLIETTKKAHFRITEDGLSVLKQNPRMIDVAFLKQFPEFLNFMRRGKKTK